MFAGTVQTDPGHGLYNSGVIVTTKNHHTMDPTTTSLTLRCLSFTKGDKIYIHNEFAVFVPLDSGEKFEVSHLKATIFGQMSFSSGTICEANDLRLWKVNSKVSIRDTDAAQKFLDEIQINYETHQESGGRATMLQPGTKVAHEFVNWTDESVLHLLVQKPSSNPGGLPNVDGSKPGGEVMKRSLSGNWYYRPKTVQILYSLLERHRFLLVSGTPGSGKSVLAELIIQYIQNTEPNTQVVFLSGWIEDIVRQPTYYNENVEQKGWNISNPKSVLVIDEAQETYSDKNFWVGKVKKIANEMFVTMKGRIILFASYGSPSMRFLNFNTTPILIPESRRIGLWPIDHDNGLPSVGLFLSRDEYPAIASNGVANHHFDSTFLEWVYEITAGHVGAFVDILLFTKAQPCYRECKHGRKLTLQSFVETVLPEKFWTWLGENTVFSRGMPSPTAFKDIEIRNVLEHLCISGFVKRNQISEGTIEHVEKCHFSGWLYCYKENDGDHCYIFSTPLHQWFVAWNIWQLKPIIPPEATILEFVKRVIRGFSFSRLFAVRRVNPIYTQNIPEAHFQQEFYRACGLSSTLIFPEFGCNSGRVDFYVPSKEWAIELLREGRGIQEHCDRFSYKYYKGSIPVEDHIILDCRTSIPTVTRSDDHFYYLVIVSRNAYLLDHDLKEVDCFAIDS